MGGDSGMHPCTVHCFPGEASQTISFDTVEDIKAAQIINTPIDPSLEVYTQLSLKPFNNISYLALYFPNNQGDSDHTRISYIGLQGSHSHSKREAVKTSYEAIPLPGDSKSILGENTLFSFGKKSI